MFITTGDTEGVGVGSFVIAVSTISVVSTSYMSGGSKSVILTFPVVPPPPITFKFPLTSISSVEVFIFVVVNKLALVFKVVLSLNNMPTSSVGSALLYKCKIPVSW